jgi:uncharacterized SAM-binding protein YcdF (DUF218 family)
MGLQGWISFLLSNAVILLSLGTTWAWACVRVWRIAHYATMPPPASSWLLVPGMKLQGSGISTDFRQRLDCACMWAQGTTEYRILLLGGASGDGSFTEAGQGKSYLVEQGLPASQIFCEELSRNTRDNLIQARNYLGKHSTLATIISNRYHLARLGLMATRLGLPHRLCPAEKHLVLSPAMIWKMIREGYFVHWFVVGGVWVRLSNNEDSLQGDHE